MNWFRRWAGKRPSNVYKFRYERADGHYREISVPVGFGRFRQGTEKAAREIAERRLAEQYGDLEREQAKRHLRPSALENRPDLHQDNYRYVGVERL